MTKRPGYSQEVRERAVRMVYEHRNYYPSRWAAVTSIASKIGCSAQTLQRWIKRREVDTGQRAGVTAEEQARVKAMERELKELRRANEILRKASVDSTGRRNSPQTREVAMSPRGTRQAARSTRRPLRSPGRPSAGRREDRVRFWAAIAHGLYPAAAVRDARVSWVVGARWFRQAGGMPPTQLAVSAPQLSGRSLSFVEREQLALLRAGGNGVRECARQLHQSPSTVSRELRPNAATRSDGFDHAATSAQWHADRAACRPKATKLATHPRLHHYVQERLAGVITTPGGTPARGPTVTWTGRKRGGRQHRRWGRAWSPAQIAQRLVIDFPNDPTMRISHEAIYQALYVEGRGALPRALTACLLTGRALRAPRARTRQAGRRFVPPELLIRELPAEVADRAVPGHWEGDLILGLQSSAIGTLIERTTRFTLLLHLPRMAGNVVGVRVTDTKNGPPLAGHGAAAVRAAITRAMRTLPPMLRRSLTWDQGAEMADHVQLKTDVDLAIHFCDPRSPWQRGSNENTNGLLRQYFPKGIDLSQHRAVDLAAVALALNTRPRKSLGWRTPIEALDALVQSSSITRVATTG